MALLPVFPKPAWITNFMFMCLSEEARIAIEFNQVQYDAYGPLLAA